MIEELAAHATGTLCNTGLGVLPLDSGIVPMLPGRRIVGLARTARIAPGQNAAVHIAVHRAQPGEILVVDGAGSTRFGPFGDLLAECCQHRGLVGAVFDCTIRDRTDITALGFPVFSRGFHPESTAKTDPGEVDVPVTVGGVTVSPGDVIVGDDDGVVAIPRALLADVLVAARAVADREERIRERLREGATTAEIFGLANPT